MLHCSHGRKNKNYTGNNRRALFGARLWPLDRGILALKQRLLAISPGPWAVSLLVRRMLARNLKSLEYDPHVQYRFHQSFMFFWVIAIGVVWFLPDFHAMAPRLIMEVSLYANFATDFGAMSAALAAGNYHCPGCNCHDKDTMRMSAEQTQAQVPGEAKF